MSRPIRVNDRHGVPRSLTWRGRTYVVQAVWERWKDTGRWWEGEPPKLFFRVQTAGGGLWEIYFDTGNKAWYLYKTYD